MQDYQEAMVKSLVAVAWADGRVDAEEHEVIEALIGAFELEGADAAHIREYAQSPRSIDEIPLTELSLHDRRMLVQHAVILTYMDGHQSDKEKEVLAALVAKLHLPEEETGPLLAAAEERAKRLASLL